MTDLSRRSFLGAAGAAALGPVAAAPAVAQSPLPRTPSGASPSASHAPPAAAKAPYAFLDAREARFVEAACARLIPSDEIGPGATEAGVATYIDRQLAGAWGAGDKLYRSGPWTPGTPSQGYQLPYTPAELFRTALREVRADLERSKRGAFEALPPAEQDAYLTALQEGRVELASVPAKTFFDTLLTMTIEGFFCDPVYGGNQGKVGWSMIGFPGAYANHYLQVGLNEPFRREPASLAEDAAGHVHVAPLRRVTTTPAKGR